MIPALNNKLNGCSLEQDGEDFYIVGADSVRKKLGKTVVKIGNGYYNGEETYKIDIKPYVSDYTNITSDDFYIRVRGIVALAQTLGNTNLDFSYNANTGILSTSKFVAQYASEKSIAVYYYIFLVS